MHSQEPTPATNADRRGSVHPRWLESVLRVASAMAASTCDRGSGVDPADVAQETVVRILLMQKRLRETPLEALPPSLQAMASALRDGADLETGQRAIVGAVARNVATDMRRSARPEVPVGDAGEAAAASRCSLGRGEDPVGRTVEAWDEAARKLAALRSGIPNRYGPDAVSRLALGLAEGMPHAELVSELNTKFGLRLTSEGLRALVYRIKRRHPELRPVLERRQAPEARASRGGGRRPSRSLGSANKSFEHGSTLCRTCPGHPPSAAKSAVS